VVNEHLITYERTSLLKFPEKSFSTATPDYVNWEFSREQSRPFDVLSQSSGLGISASLRGRQLDRSFPPGIAPATVDADARRRRSQPSPACLARQCRKLPLPQQCGKPLPSQRASRRPNQGHEQGCESGRQGLRKIQDSGTDPTLQVLACTTRERHSDRRRGSAPVRGFAGNAIQAVGLRERIHPTRSFHPTLCPFLAIGTGNPRGAVLDREFWHLREVHHSDETRNHHIG